MRLGDERAVHVIPQPPHLGAESCGLKHVRALQHMARVIRFSTAKFDVSKERPNPINPIPGESLLLWLQDQAKPHVEVTDPDAEDWGWYAFVEWKGRQYMLGSSASDEENGQREWILQVVKQRSAKEKLLGREKMGADDDCAQFFQHFLEQERSFTAVSVDEEP